MELQSQYEELQRRGLGLVAISYDPPAVLRKFSESRGITFPLISDAGSAIMTQYGLLNTAEKPGSRTYGIPYPGTLILDRNGIVRSRYFEEAYQERNTAARILVAQGATPFGPVMSVETKHLLVAAAASDREAAPGRRMSFAFDIEPRAGMHVYAPGKHGYQVITVILDSQPWLKVASLRYPPSEIYHFKPLDERIEVYLKPFRLVQDFTILATPEAQKLLAAQQSVTITGRLNYQACDDKICYSPQSVAFKWSLPLKPLDRRPPG